MHFWKFSDPLSLYDMFVYLKFFQAMGKGKSLGNRASPLRVKVAVLTPITWPYESINGPPEFPAQTAQVGSEKMAIIVCITGLSHYHRSIST